MCLQSILQGVFEDIFYFEWRVGDFDGQEWYR